VHGRGFCFGAYRRLLATAVGVRPVRVCKAATHSSERLVGCDLVFDLAERGSGEHPLGYKLVNGCIRPARDDGPPEAPAQAVQLLNGSRVDVDKLRVTRLRSATVVRSSSRAMRSMMGCAEDAEG
jgi:hypothetical protein